MRRVMLVFLLLVAAHAPATEQLLVVCFGDSITGHKPGVPYLQHYSKYSDMLQLLIEGRRGIGSAAVINSGWAGDATYAKRGQGMPGGLARLQQDVIDHQPAIVTILFGVNNKSATEADKQRLHDDLRNMVEQVQAARIKVLLVLYHDVLPNPDKPEQAWKPTTEANAIIARVAEELGVPTVDLRPAFTAAVEQHPRVELVNANDGLHLAPRGEMVIARTLFARMSELGWLD